VEPFKGCRSARLREDSLDNRTPTRLICAADDFSAMISRGVQIRSLCSPSMSPGSRC
jgi:hypothetical protein